MANWAIEDSNLTILSKKSEFTDELSVNKITEICRLFLLTSKTPKADENKT